MASRLSDESLKEIYETGTQGLLWRPDGAIPRSNSSERDAGDFIDLANLIQTVDLDALIDSEEPGEAIANVDPVTLYYSMQRKGPEECVDIIPHLTSEQFIKILDYEAWDRDRLSLGSALQWLEACRSVSKEELFTKFISLEEEVQTGLLGSMVDYIEEEQYELLSHNDQDTYQQLPCRTAWWRINTDDQTQRSIIEDLIDGGFGLNIGYTYSLLAHAANLPPNEQEEMALQFRNARLEEDGFIPFEEAQLIFRGLDADPLARKYGFADGRACLMSGIDQESFALVASESTYDYFDVVIKEVRRQFSEENSSAQLIDPQLFLQSFAHLVNTVCSAVQTTPDNDAGMKLVLVQLKGLIGTALDLLSESDVKKAAQIIAAEHPRDLFRFALGSVNFVRQDAIQALHDAAFPAAKKINTLWQIGRYGALLFSIDTDLLESVGFESSETLKGLFNKFPMRPVSQRFLPDGDRRIVYKNLSSRMDLAMLKRDVANLSSTWRKQQ